MTVRLNLKLVTETSDSQYETKLWGKLNLTQVVIYLKTVQYSKPTVQ